MKNFFDKNTKRSNRVFAAYAGILCLVLVWNLFHCSSWSWDIRQLPLQEGCGISPDEEGRFEFRDGKELTLRFEAPGPQEVREGAELCGAALLNYENRNHLRFSTEVMTAVLRDESGRERAASRLPLIRQTPSVYDETLLYFSFDTDETAQIGRDETLELVVRSEGLTRNGVFFGTDRPEGKDGTEADPAVRIYYRTKTFSPFLSIFYFILEILAGLFCLRMVNAGGMPLFPAKDPVKDPTGIPAKKTAKRQEGISAKKPVKNRASGPAAGKAAASAAGLLALLVFMGFTYIYAIRPLAGTCSAEILCSREDASDSITLESGDTLRQTVRCGQDRLSGFGIFLEKGTKTDADEVNPEDSGDPAESAGSADSTDSAGSAGASGSEGSGASAGSTDSAGAVESGDSAGSAGSGASAGSTGPARIAWKLYDGQAAAAGENLSESSSPVLASGEETGVQNPVLASGEGSVDSLRSVRSLLGHDAQGTEILDASEKAVWLPLDAPVRAAAGRSFLLELTNMGPGPVTITATGQTNGTATMIAETEADNADGRNMAGGEVLEKEICLMAGYRSNGFVNGFFLRLCAVVLVLFAAIQAFCAWKNPSVQALYLACALSLGLVYSFVTPAYTVSDERTHIDSIYMMSNQLLGLDELPGPDKLYKRAADIDSSITNTMPLTAARYRAVEEGLLRGIPSDADAASANGGAGTGTESEFAKSGSDAGQNSANGGAGAGTDSGRAYAVGYARTALENVTVFNYLPAALGFTLGRLTGRNLITMVMLARWMNLLACAAVMYAAVRIMPRGKACLAMIGLFPKTLQQTASCSYDGMLIAGTCFFIACFLAVRDGLQKQRDISALEVLLLLYAGCFVAANKAGTYLPVTGLILLLPLYGRQWTAGAVSAGTAKGVSAGTARGTGRKRKNPLVLQCVLIMAGFCSVFAAKSLVRVFGMLSRSSGSETLVSGTRTLYSIADFLHSPAGLVRVMVNTLRLRGDGLLGELVGKNLCQRWVFVYAFLFLAWLGILAEKRTPAKRKGLEKNGSAEEAKGLKENAAREETGKISDEGRDLVSRVWIFLLICAGTFLIFLSMLLGFTEKGLGYVDGLQGRYFLPYAPLVFLILRTRRLERKDLTDTMILRAGFFLELLTFFEILCAYFHVW